LGSVRWGAVCAVAVGVLALASGDARADIRTYTDSSGVIHFSSPKSKTKAVTSREPKARATPVMPSQNAGDRASRYDDVIREAAALYRIPEELVRAVIKVESNFDPRAVSR